MVLKFLHIALIFGGLTLIYGTEVLLHRIGRSGDTAAIRTAFRIGRPLASAGPALFFVGVGFGIAAGLFNGYDLLAPWLLASYVLVGLLVAGGVTITVPWMQRVESLSAVASDGTASSELADVLHERRVVALMYVSIAVDVVIVALMVFKPGG